MKEMMLDNGKGMKDQRRNSGMGCDGSVVIAKMNAKECECKTVRQLSRLWRYAGGCKLSSQGVGMMNSVGLGFSGMDIGKMPNEVMMKGMNSSLNMGNMSDMDMGNLDMVKMEMNGMDVNERDMKNIKDIKKGMKSSRSIDMRNGVLAHGM